MYACAEFNVHTDLKKMRPNETPRDYDFVKKLNFVKENMPYCSYFMSWNRVWGPYVSDAYDWRYR